MIDELVPILDDNGGGGNRKRAAVTAIILAVVFTLAFITATLISKFVTKTFTVDGTSMHPTLSGGVSGDYGDGDKVVVNRLSKIKRGDIVVLYASGYNNALVKRAIALEGDTLEIKDGVIFINGSAIEENYLTEENKILRDINGTPINKAKETVPEGHIYVLGDNRLVSNDSRYLGYIPLSSVEGKVFLIIRENKTLALPKK